MCGIVGKYNFASDEPVAPQLLTVMCDKITYRGPDDSGIYHCGPVGLGHRRLSIIDLSPLGHQPMASDDKKLWIVFNGEIYNFQQLRRQLESLGYRFVSNCDTEVIIYMYRQYGAECLQYLRGMFAFAIWDQECEQLFLARDRIGKKPLFYYCDGKHFLFASEIKSLLVDPVVAKVIDPQALYDYFCYLYVPDPKTIYRHIRKLEPGHYLVCSRQGIADKQYWDIHFHHKLASTREEIAAQLRTLLDESVGLRMISDVPLGAFLSGGIDSSAVVALMARQQTRPVTTCSIGFAAKQYDELDFARMIARQFHTDHHEFTVEQKAEEILGELAYYFDEPFADQSAVPTYYVSKLARQRVTVALAGDGGDENFIGYEKYFLDDVENQVRRKIPRLLRATLGSLLSRALVHAHHPLLGKAATLLNTLSYEADYGFYLSNSECTDRQWRQIIRQDFRRELGDYHPFSVVQRYYHQADSDNHLARIIYTDLKNYLPGDILVKVDRMSMANSLEVRAPLLDHRVIEFAAAIPEWLKYQRGEKKYILKYALEPLLPRQILYRRKMGFCVPLAHWLRGELQPLARHYLFAKNAGLKHFFKPAPLRRIWQMHQHGIRDYAVLLWSFLMFELWYQNFME